MSIPARALSCTPPVMEGSLPCITSSFRISVRKLFLEPQFSLWKPPPGGRSPAFQNQVGCLLQPFPTESTFSLPPVISFTDCVGPVPSWDMTCSPGPPLTSLLCTPAPLPTLVTRTLSRLQFGSGHRGVIPTWWLQMWGYHLRFASRAVCTAPVSYT